MRPIPAAVMNAITSRICEIADMEHPGESGLVTVLLEGQTVEISWADAGDITDLLVLFPEDSRKIVLDYFDAPPIPGRVLAYFLDAENGGQMLGYVDYKAVETGHEQDYLN